MNQPRCHHSEGRQKQTKTRPQDRRNIEPKVGEDGGAVSRQLHGFGRVVGGEWWLRH